MKALCDSRRAGLWGRTAACLLLAATPVFPQGSVTSEDLPDPSREEAPPQTSPRPADAELADLLRLAEESYAQDDLVTAVALYRQLAERQEDPRQRNDQLVIVAWLLHQKGDTGAALQTLTDVLVADPDYPFRSDLYSESFVPLFYDAQARALQTREARASSLAVEGKALMEARRFDEARSKLRQAIEVWPDEPRAHYTLAMVDYHEGKRAAALDGFQKVLALGAARPQLVDNRLESSALANLALLYLERDQLSEASEALSRAVIADPGNASAWLNLGVASRRSGETGRALEAFRKAWELSSGDVDAGRNLALAHMDSGDPAAAVRLLDQLAAENPDDAGLYVYLGRAKNALQDLPGAAGAFEAAIARDGDNASGWAGQAALQLAGLRYAQGDFHATLQQADRTVIWLPERVNGWVYQGLARQSLGQLDEARESLETALRLAPARADIHNSLGSVLFELSRFDDAQRSFERALQLQPDLEAARRNLDAVKTVKRGDAVASRRGSGKKAKTSRTETPRPPAARGTPVQRPDIGLRFSEVDYASLGLQGVMVEKVFPGTAADRAGVEADDLLLKMDGRAVGDAAGLRAYVAGLPKGARLVLELLRDNRPVSLQLVVP